MDLPLPHLAATFSDAAFAYLILAAQVSMGLPPFYRSLRPLLFGELGSGCERMVKLLVPFLAGIMVMAVAWIVSGIALFHLAMGAIAAAGGLVLRRDLRRATGGTLHWMPHPWLFHPAALRWPMLAFDLWTVSIAGLFGLMML